MPSADRQFDDRYYSPSDSAQGKIIDLALDNAAFRGLANKEHFTSEIINEVAITLQARVEASIKAQPVITHMSPKMVQGQTVSSIERGLKGESIINYAHEGNPSFNFDNIINTAINNAVANIQATQTQDSQSQAAVGPTPEPQNTSPKPGPTKESVLENISRIKKEIQKEVKKENSSVVGRLKAGFKKATGEKTWQQKLLKRLDGIESNLKTGHTNANGAETRTVQVLKEARTDNLNPPKWLDKIGENVAWQADNASKSAESLSERVEAAGLNKNTDGPVPAQTTSIPTAGR